LTERRAMLVPDEIRKCVCFVGLERADGRLEFVGTAFFLGRVIPGTEKFVGYAVTAKHVVKGIQSRGLDRLHLRVNRVDGTAEWLLTHVSDWLFHPTDATADVAVHRGTPTGAVYDHLAYPLSEVVPPSQLTSLDIGVGTEVFVVGLFVNHVGARRNVPIVRMGSIAALPEEPILTDVVPLEAILIEARSIGGLSGSPVFALQPTLKVVNGKLMAADKAVFHLIGLMRGHWDAEVGDANAASEARVNMGIGIVVPSSKILEVLTQPTIAEYERRLV
jgi:hypothetical protein